MSKLTFTDDASAGATEDGFEDLAEYISANLKQPHAFYQGEDGVSTLIRAYDSEGNSGWIDFAADLDLHEITLKLNAAKGGMEIDSDAADSEIEEANFQDDQVDDALYWLYEAEAGMLDDYSGYRNAPTAYDSGALRNAMEAVRKAVMSEMSFGGDAPTFRPILDLFKSIDY